MTLYDRIIAIYPTLTLEDFMPPNGAITLQNDGNGDYIKEWNHANFSQPTQEQVA
jgi:hypothetical protein